MRSSSSSVLSFRLAYVATAVSMMVALALIMCGASVNAFRIKGYNNFNKFTSSLHSRDRILHDDGTGTIPIPVVLRGGASSTLVEEDVDVDSDEEEEDEYEEEEEEEDDEEDEDVEVDPKLVSAMLKSNAKAKAKEKSSIKEVMNEKLAKSQKDEADVPVEKSKGKKSPLSFFKIPYIIRATLNPLTFFAMTKAYWASLFDFEYGKEETSQELRSALEDKAKKGGNARINPSSGKGKKKMKRGQAKTLSDLPQLNT